MTIVIKREYSHVYRPELLAMKFQYLNSVINGNQLMIVATGTDGSFYYFKYHHVKVITPLEVALE